jgi:transposase
MRKNLHYSLSLKLEAVKMNLENGYSTRQIAKNLSVSSHRLVVAWVAKYEAGGASALENKTGKNSGKRSGRPKKILTIEDDNIRLRAENDYLRAVLEMRGVLKKK